MSCIPTFKHAIRSFNIGRSHYLYGVSHDVFNPPLSVHWVDYLQVCGDYFTAPEGHLADHRVIFHDRSGTSLGSNEIRQVVRHLIDARGNDETIELMLNAASFYRVVTRVEDSYQVKHHSLRQRLIPSLDALVRHLVEFALRSTTFVECLLEGRLHCAIELVAAMPIGIKDANRALSLVTAMATLWGLHDLQAIAARLFRCIWISSPTGTWTPATLVYFDSLARNVESLDVVLDAVLEWRSVSGQAAPHPREAEIPVLLEQLGIAMYASADLWNRSRESPVQIRVIRRKLALMRRHLAPIMLAIREARKRSLLIANRGTKGNRLASRIEAKVDFAVHRFGIEAATLMAAAVISFARTCSDIEALVEVEARMCGIVKPKVTFFPGLQRESASGVTLEQEVEAGIFTAVRAVFFRDGGNVTKATRKNMAPLDELINANGRASGNVILPHHGGGALTDKDACLGVGLTPRDKAPNLQPHTHRDEHGDVVTYRNGKDPSSKRPGRDALENGRGLLRTWKETKPEYAELFLSSIPWRLALDKVGLEAIRRRHDPIFEYGYAEEFSTAARGRRPLGGDR